MKIVRHPNIVRLLEVMASTTKIYLVMELVTGGELFDKIATKKLMGEIEARKYFQQLICAVDYCHSRGVSHRDLKPENLLLDANGVLKVSDFGLSALPQHRGEDGLFHTTCGSPNYMAPEVIHGKGYDGAKADLWSCGVILFVILAGYMPFNEESLPVLYEKISKAEFSYPPMISKSVKNLLGKILKPNPDSRIKLADIYKDDWFMKRGYTPPRFEHEEANLVDLNSVFNEGANSQNLVVERQEEVPVPFPMNAFEIISISQGLNIGNIFKKYTGFVQRETRFTSKSPLAEIISKIENVAVPLDFVVKKNNNKLKLQGVKSGLQGHLVIIIEIMEVLPSISIVELRKCGGDILEFYKFYKALFTEIKDIIWKDPIKNPIEDRIQEEPSVSAEDDVSSK